MNVTLKKISENGRGRPRPLRESENLYTSPVVSATTSNKNFQKIRYRAPDSRSQTDGRTDRQTDGWTHEHSEIINIDSSISDFDETCTIIK